MRDTLDASLADFTNAFESFPWHDKRAYADWTAQTYYYVRHSTRLLAAAAARFPQSDAGNALHRRFGAHIAEERGHEKLSLSDLKRLGFTIDQFPERCTTRMFYEPQYYKVEHQSPMVLFGYILPLEAAAPRLGRRVVEIAEREFGPGCAKFLKLHAEEDDGHLESAFEALKRISSDEAELVRQNIRQTVHGYVAMLAEIRANGDA